MIKITDRIKSGEILVSDGAWGTQLQSKGLKTGECPELWNITHGKEIYEIAESYINAGSDMIETNSFGGNRFRLAEYGLERRLSELNKKAAQLSRKAAGNNHYVLGSIGPSGKFIMMDEVSPAELTETFSEQAIALKEGGADAIIIETMTDLNEACIAVRAVRESTDCEIICTMTFDKSAKNAFHTMMGVSPEDMVRELVSSGADIIGVNCGRGIADMPGLVKEIRKYDGNIPLMIQPNAGIPIFRKENPDESSGKDPEQGKIIYTESPEYMAEISISVINAGANIIGGCCGTTPEHIRQIAAIVKNRRHGIK